MLAWTKKGRKPLPEAKICIQLKNVGTKQNEDTNCLIFLQHYTVSKVCCYYCCYLKGIYVEKKKNYVI